MEKDKLKQLVSYLIDNYIDFQITNSSNTIMGKISIFECYDNDILLVLIKEYNFVFEDGVFYKRLL